MSKEKETKQENEEIAKVIEIDTTNIDIRIKCKCGEIFNEVDKDFNDWAECPKCHIQYKVYLNFDEKNIELEEI